MSGTELSVTALLRVSGSVYLGYCGNQCSVAECGPVATGVGRTSDGAVAPYGYGAGSTVQGGILGADGATFPQLR